MGDRKEARVERHRERREGACLGRKDRASVEEGFKTRVGESLGADREPWRTWMGLSEQAKSFRIDANDNQMNLRNAN